MKILFNNIFVLNLYSIELFVKPKLIRKPVVIQGYILKIENLIVVVQAIIEFFGFLVVLCQLLIVSLSCIDLIYFEDCFLSCNYDCLQSF
jgi:hypothetical protein